MFKISNLTAEPVLIIAPQITLVLRKVMFENLNLSCRGHWSIKLSSLAAAAMACQQYGYSDVLLDL